MNPSFQFPLSANRHASFTNSIRQLLATTAAFWMGTAQSHVATPLQQCKPAHTARREEPGASRPDLNN